MSDTPLRQLKHHVHRALADLVLIGSASNDALDRDLIDRELVIKIVMRLRRQMDAIEVNDE